MSDYSKRYDAATEEMAAALVEWDLAEKAMARANARRSSAERNVHRLYQERIGQINEAKP